MRPAARGGEIGGDAIDDAGSRVSWNEDARDEVRRELRERTSALGVGARGAGDESIPVLRRSQVRERRVRRTLEVVRDERDGSPAPRCVMRTGCRGITSK